jgi:hypothetical protein
MRFVAMLGHPAPLTCPATAGDNIKKTVLILIQNISPRRVRALYKVYHDDLPDDEVLRRYDSIPGGWSRFPPRNGRRTRLDLNLHDALDGDARVFFKIEPPDVFMDDIGGDVLSLSGTDAASLNQLYCPRRVNSGTGEYDIACMIVKAGADTNFVLGVVIQDNDNVEVWSPVFFDPKIENNG